MSFLNTTSLSNLDHWLQKTGRAIHILSGKCDIEASHKLLQINIVNETLIYLFSEYLKLFDIYIIKYGPKIKSKEFKFIFT